MSALVTFEMKCPLIVGFSKLVSDTEYAKFQVVVSSENLNLFLAFKNHFNEIVEILRFL